MDFGYSQRVLDLQAKLRSFMTGLVRANNERWHRGVEAGSYPLELIDKLKAQAKASGLWNLFLPGLRDDEPGTRLTSLEYAPLAETEDAPPLVRTICAVLDAYLSNQGTRYSRPA